MVAVTYGVARAAAGALKGKKAKTAKKQPGFFARLNTAIVESHMRQAERELALFGYTRTQDDDVPFVRGW
jgi:hypothetical protein